MGLWSDGPWYGNRQDEGAIRSWYVWFQINCRGLGKVVSCVCRGIVKILTRRWLLWVALSPSSSFLVIVGVIY